MHHPPVKVGAYFDSPHADPAPLIACLTDRVKGVFCGHVHWEEYRQLAPGVPLHTTPATCSQYTFGPDDPPTAMKTPHPPAYRVIECGCAGDLAELTTRVVWVPEAAAVANHMMQAAL